uniref:Uncharacterized protein n=1 Tax=Fagus sylvatica TaxID=28930 RepID=A0A2N9GDX1_FAGSY
MFYRLTAAPLPFSDFIIVIGWFFVDSVSDACLDGDVYVRKRVAGGFDKRITVGELNGDSHGGEDVDSLKGKRGVDVVEEEGETLAEAGGGRRDDKNGGDPNCGRFLPSLIDFLTCP